MVADSIVAALPRARWPLNYNPLQNLSTGASKLDENSIMYVHVMHPSLMLEKSIKYVHVMLEKSIKYVYVMHPSLMLEQSIKYVHLMHPSLMLEKVSGMLT